MLECEKLVTRRGPHAAGEEGPIFLKSQYVCTSADMYIGPKEYF